MTARTVVVVDPYSSGNLFAEALRKHGYVPVAATTSRVPPEIYTESFRPRDFDHVEVLEPGVGVDDLVARLRHLAPVAVVAGAETGVELADRLSAALTPGLANAPDLVAARRHKGEMARAVAAAGVPMVPTLCTGDAEEVEDWLERTGLSGQEIVLKPPRSGGGNGFAVVGAAGDWRTPFEKILRTPDQYRNLDGEVVVQQRMHGTEYAIDTVTRDGKHAVTAICRYGKVSNMRHDAVYGSIEYLPFDLPGHVEIVDYVCRVLDAVGVRFGAAHTEVMVTADGVRLVETGVRVAGGGLPEVCRLATGASPVDLLVTAIDAGLGRMDYDLVLPALVAFVVVREDGVVRNAEVFSEVEQLSSHCGSQIGLRTGERVRSTADLITTMRTGWVLLGNADRLQLYTDYRALREIEASLVIEQEGADHDA